MKASEMTRLIEAELKHKSIYVWGGQGESLADTPFSDIIEMESTSGDKMKNTERILTHLIQVLASGYDYRQIRLFDCSGLIVWALQKLGLVVGDYTADNLYCMGTEVPIKNAKEGDLAFKGTSTHKTHVGYVTGNKTVIECKGRDYGVVESSLNGWSFACHYTWFETNDLDHKLKLSSAATTYSKMVENVQKALCSKGCLCVVNGVFTQNTADAVKKFQKIYKLEPLSPGVISKKTCLALGMSWKGKLS